MAEHQWIWSIEETIPSHRGAGDSIIKQILSQLQKHEWIQSDSFGIHLALEEAVTNAIRHGNNLNAEKNVRVACRISGDRLLVEVEDEGPGFDPCRVPDPTDDEHLERPCGRGIMLMRSFMCRVDFNQTGNCVTMEKNRAEAS